MKRYRLVPFYSYSVARILVLLYQVNKLTHVLQSVEDYHIRGMATSGPRDLSHIHLAAPGAHVVMQPGS